MVRLFIRNLKLLITRSRAVRRLPQVGGVSFLEDGIRNTRWRLVVASPRESGSMTRKKLALSRRAWLRYAPEPLIRPRRENLAPRDPTVAIVSAPGTAGLRSMTVTSSRVMASKGRKDTILKEISASMLSRSFSTTLPPTQDWTLGDCMAASAARSTRSIPARTFSGMRRPFAIFL